MKKSLFFLWVALAATACSDKKNIPDVSGIPVSVKIERFDNAFFALDSNHLSTGLYRLSQQYPYFFTDFTANILGVGVLSDTSTVAFAQTLQFMKTYLPVRDSLMKKFDNLDWLEKDLKKSFQYVKYYFPKYPLPQKVVTYIGPFDAPGVAITQYALAIGLQLYAGKNFSFYSSLQGQEMYPLYISRRFEPQYIQVNCVKAIARPVSG